MQNNKAVVIWSEGFPYNQIAINEKNSLIAKALILKDYDVYLTSKAAFGNNAKNEGIVDGIHYLNFSRKCVKSRLIQYFSAAMAEMRFISSLKKTHKCVYLIGSYVPIIIYFFYSVFCKTSGVRLVLSIMEWHIAAHEGLSVPKRINGFLFDKYAFLISGGTIAISEHIISNLSFRSSNGKFLLIPALTDVIKIDGVRKEIGEFRYILYCGGIGYSEVIEIVFEAFQKLKDEIILVLVLHGNHEQIEKFKKKITNNSCSDRVLIFSHLDYPDLIKYYKNASVLLVPLRNSIQDTARYPQKIAEYAACARPILSNAIGQVGLDFCHKKDIYFANSVSSTDLSDGIRVLLQDESMTELISENARRKAEQYFDYRNYSDKLDQFLKNL